MRSWRLLIGTLVLLAALAALFVVYTLAGTDAPRPLAAQDAQSGSFAQVIARLGQSGAALTFQFRTAHAEYDSLLSAQSAAEGTTLTVPFRSSNGEVTISLGEIGQDYVCFDETRGGAALARCVPFAEIASVVYAR